MEGNKNMQEGGFAVAITILLAVISALLGVIVTLAASYFRKFTEGFEAQKELNSTMVRDIACKVADSLCCERRSTCVHKLHHKED